MSPFQRASRREPGIIARSTLSGSWSGLVTALGGSGIVPETDCTTFCNALTGSSMTLSLKASTLSMTSNLSSTKDDLFQRG